MKKLLLAAALILASSVGLMAQTSNEAPMKETQEMVGNQKDKSCTKMAQKTPDEIATFGVANLKKDITLTASEEKKVYALLKTRATATKANKEMRRQKSDAQKIAFLQLTPAEREAQKATLRAERQKERKAYRLENIKARNMFKAELTKIIGEDRMAQHEMGMQDRRPAHKARKANQRGEKRGMRGEMKHGQKHGENCGMGCEMKHGEKQGNDCGMACNMKAQKDCGSTCNMNMDKKCGTECGMKTGEKCGTDCGMMK